MRIVLILDLFVIYVFVDVDDFVIEELGVDNVLEVVVWSLVF